MAEKREIRKLVFLGDINNKSKMRIRHKYFGEGFKQSYNMVAGADFAIKRMVLDGREIVLQLWDLNDDTDYASTREVYYGATDAMILVFDTNHHSSFEALPNWISEVMEGNKNRLSPMLLIGIHTGKSDQEVDFEEASDYATQLSQWSGIDTPYLEINIETDYIKATNDITTFDEALELLVKNILSQ